MLVARTRRRTVLSPFFAKSDGLLVIEPGTDTREFRQNPLRTSQATRDLILASDIDRLVCGFIAEPERDTLSASGIDIRVGSCARSIEALVRDFDNLPPA